MCAWYRNPDPDGPYLIRCRKYARWLLTVKEPGDCYQLKRCDDHAEKLRERADSISTIEILADEAILKGDIMKSIIHPKFEGSLILISGHYGVGKTTLGITLENPELTAMIDFDLKSRGIAQELGIWYRAPEGNNGVIDFDVKELATWFIKTLMEVPKDKTHLIIDNATWGEAGLGERVRQNPQKYGVNPSNAQSGRYGGVNPGITKLWAAIFGYLQDKGIKVVTAINHMSQPWVDGAPVPNKFNVKGNKIFRQISSLALVLIPADPTRGGQPPAPSGLIIKEAFNLTRFDPKTGNFTVRRALPTRLPVANWNQVKTYFDAPADFDNPASGETWSDWEIEAYSEWLSKEQVSWVLKVGSYSDEVEEIVKKTSPQKKPPKKPSGNGCTAKGAMTEYWLAVKEAGLSRQEGQRILQGENGDPVKALDALQGIKQTPPDATVQNELL